MTQEQVKKLREFALEIRIGTVECIKSRGFGHIGGSLSVADLLAVLYGGVMNVDPADPKKPDRDKLVCSKGHAGPAVYATLALKGYFPYEKLFTLNQPGTDLPSHCDRKKTPGIDMTTRLPDLSDRRRRRGGRGPGLGSGDVYRCQEVDQSGLDHRLEQETA